MDFFKISGKKIKAPTELSVSPEILDKAERTVAIIKECIKNGECSANEVLRQCEDQGIAKRTVNEAKARLNIESVKRKGGWFWIAGEDEDSDDDD